MTDTTYAVTIVSHTHWDREWYRPYQVFRLQMVELVDRLLDILDTEPDYHSFLLDGQTILLEDYLEIRPEQEETLKRYIKKGRILVGPWHILPDEFLVSPEATVRNLMLGAKTSARFGARMPVGYSPDAFGHISQLPQIFAGVGLDVIALQRGLSDEPTELWWDAPDGTRSLLIYFRTGYGNLAWAPATVGGFVRAVERQISQLAPHAHTRQLLLLNGTDHMMPQQELPRLIAAANKQLDGRAIIEHGTLPKHVAAVRSALDENTTLPVITGELRSPKRWPVLPGVYSARMWIKQHNHACEVGLERYAEPISAITELLGDTRRTSELWRAWRYLIENHPHDSICGCSVDRVHEEMHTRFEWSDQISESLTEGGLHYLARQIDSSLLYAPPAVTSSAIMPAHTVNNAVNNFTVLVYNPVPGQQTGEVEISVPWAGPRRYYGLFDQNGERIPYQIIDGEGNIDESRELAPDELSTFFDQIEIGFYKGRLISNVSVWIDGQDVRFELLLPEYHTGNIGAFSELINALRDDDRLQTAKSYHLTTYLAGTYRLAFIAQNISGIGYAAYRLASLPDEADSDNWELPPATQRTELAIENEWFHIVADRNNGRLVLTDKITGQVFDSLHIFEDGGDRGDEYNYCPPAQDQCITTPTKAPIIECWDAGTQGQTLSIKAEYVIPSDLSIDRDARSAEITTLPITSTIRLMPDVRRVDVRAELENRAQNHRLRVLFPTQIQSGRVIVDGHYDRLERLPGEVSDTTTWRERPAKTAAQRAFSAIEENGQGLLVAVRGLPEYSFIPEDRGDTLAVTLLRSVGWLSRDDLACRPGHAGPERATPGAQCLGTAVFEYSLIPFGGIFGIHDAAQEAYAFVAPLRAATTESYNGLLSVSAQFLMLEPAELVLTAIKPAESGEGVIVRFYNASNETVSGRLSVEMPVRQVMPTNLLEEPTGESLTLENDGTVMLDVMPKRIMTLHFR
jgi:mannosylglycerate hydrolase